MRFAMLIFLSLFIISPAYSVEDIQAELTLVRNRICELSAQGVPQGDNLAWIQSKVGTVTNIVHAMESAYVPASNEPTIMSAAEADLRSSITNCIDQYFKQTSKALDVVRPKEIVSPDDVNKFVRLVLWLRKMAVNGLGGHIRSLPVQELFSDRGVKLVVSTGYNIDISVFQNALSADVKTEHVNSLKHYIGSKFDALNYQDNFQWFAQSFRNTSEKMKKLSVEILVRNIIRNGVNFTERGIQNSIAEIEDTLKYYEEEMSKEGNEWMLDNVQRDRDKVASLKAIAGSLLFTDIFNELRETLSSNPKESALIKQVVQQTAYEAADLFVWKKTTFKEGDIFLNIESGGWGDLFHSLAGLTNIFTHSGVLVAGENSGVVYYYFVDILDKINISPIGQVSDDAVYVRPKFEIKPGFTTSAMDQLKGKQVYFDYLFTSGLYSDAGDYQLYCSEFIHFLYKNGFEANPLSDSPFDFIETKLNATDENAIYNIKRMGLDAKQTFYVPDHLMFNTETFYIGQELDINYGSADHPSRVRFEKELGEKLNKKLGEFFSKKKIRKIGFLEKLKIDAFILANSYMGWVSTPGIDFGDSEAKYVFVLYLQIFEAFEKSKEFSGESDTMISEEEKSLALQKFDKDVVPLIEELFTN